MFGLPNCMLARNEKILKFENIKEIPERKHNFYGSDLFGFKFALPTNDDDIVIYAPVDGIWEKKTFSDLYIRETQNFRNESLNPFDLKIENFYFLHEKYLAYQILILTKQKTLVGFLDGHILFWTINGYKKREIGISKIDNKKIFSMKRHTGTIILADGTEFVYFNKQDGCRNSSAISWALSDPIGYFRRKHKAFQALKTNPHLITQKLTNIKTFIFLFYLLLPWFTMATILINSVYSGDLV